MTSNRRAAMSRERDPRQRWVPSATPEERDDQLRRFWRRKREQEPRSWQEERPLAADQPDFRWWGPW